MDALEACSMRSVVCCDKAKAVACCSVQKIGRMRSNTCYYGWLRLNDGGEEPAFRQNNDGAIIHVFVSVKNHEDSVLESEKRREMECTRRVCEHPDF